MDYNIESLIETLIFYVTEYGIRILIALAIFVIGRMVARALARASQKIMLKANVDETLSTFLRNIVFYALLAAVVIAALGAGRHQRHLLPGSTRRRRSGRGPGSQGLPVQLRGGRHAHPAQILQEGRLRHRRRRIRPLSPPSISSTPC